MEIVDAKTRLKVYQGAYESLEQTKFRGLCAAIARAFEREVGHTMGWQISYYPEVVALNPHKDFPWWWDPDNLAVRLGALEKAIKAVKLKIEADDKD